MNDGLGRAAACAGIWLGIGAALDVLLVREGRRPITHALRTTPGRLFLTALVLHVDDRLGPLDPFRAASRLITRRST